MQSPLNIIFLFQNTIFKTSPFPTQKIKLKYRKFAVEYNVKIE